MPGVVGAFVFFFCPLAQSVLSWLQSLMFSFSFMCLALLCRHVIFGFSSDELVVTPRIFVYLLNLCKYFIWQSRNDLRFRAVRPGAAAVIARVKSRLRFHLPFFSSGFSLLAVVASSTVSGVPVESSPPSLMVTSPLPCNRFPRAAWP